MAASKGPPAAPPNGTSASAVTDESTQAQPGPVKDVAAQRLVSGSFRPLPVVFTADSNFFFCAASAGVRLHSVATGQAVRSLVDPDSTRTTGLQLNPANPLQVFTASFEGRISLWDFNDAMVVQSWHLDHNLLHFRLNPENPREAFIVVLKSKKPVASDIVPGKQTTCVVYRLDLDTNKLSKITKAKHFQTLAVNPTGKLVAIAAGKKLLLWNAADNSVRKFPHDQEISVIDFHPTAAYLAYGDQMGRILLLYYNSGAEGQAPVASTLHWHAHRVGALRFALDGEQLLSGGEESVLVVWHLQTRQKSFLPRLGAEIAALETSPDGTLIAIGLADGSVKVVTISNLTILQSIEGMRFVNIQLGVRRRPARMTYEPYRNTLAFHGPRFVQFWSLESDNHLGEVEVSPRNRISRTETRELIDAEVTHVAFDRDASWMGTVDVRDDREFPMDIYLKFWTYDPTSKSWTLSTRVDFPHGESKVSSLAFNPARRSSMALTTGEDRQFRVWTRREAEGTQYWACAATGEYKGRSCRSACFSADGSLFALTHDGQISLWDSQTLSLGTTLANPSAVGEPLVGAAFLGSGSRYLVGWTADKAHVWDLLTCVLTRTFVLACDGVVADRTADRFACFGRRPTTEGKDTAFVAVYDVTSSEPVMDYPVHGGVRAVEFVAGSKGLLRLAVLDRSGSVHSVMEKESTPAEQDGTKQGAEKASLEARGPGLFSSLAGRVVGGTAAADGPDGALAAQMAARATGADVLDVPSYLLPNLASVFDSFLAGLVSVRPIADPVMPASGPVPKATAAAKQSEAGNADVEMTDSASAAEDDYSFLVDLFRKSTSITAETPAKGGRKRKA